MKFTWTQIGSQNGVPVYRATWHDTEKNRSYVEKRKQLGERATAELGVACWG